MKNDETATRYPVDTGRELNAHKTSRTSYVRSIYVVCLRDMQYIRNIAVFTLQDF